MIPRRNVRELPNWMTGRRSWHFSNMVLELSNIHEHRLKPTYPIYTFQPLHDEFLLPCNNQNDSKVFLKTLQKLLFQFTAWKVLLKNQILCFTLTKDWAYRARRTKFLKPYNIVKWRARQYMIFFIIASAKNGPSSVKAILFPQKFI